MLKIRSLIVLVLVLLIIALAWSADGVHAGNIATPITFIGAGDIAFCSKGVASSPAAKTAAMVQTVLNADPGAMAFTLGDNAYPNGSTKDYANCYAPTWGKFKARTLPAAGNHEYETRGAAPYFAYFGAISAPDRDGYYSVDLGAWHIVVLNSSIKAGNGSAQEVWLRADLASSKAAARTTCTLAIMHHPRFSSGFHGATFAVADLWSTLYDGGTDIILSGHDHHYQRYKPISADGTYDAARGTTFFIVGTGGGPLYPALIPSLNTASLKPGVYGVLQLTLDQGSYAFAFTDVDGITWDSGRGECH